MKFEFEPIGTVHTPYLEDAPFTNYEEVEGEFYIELNEEYEQGLYLLDKLKYCYIVFYIHKQKKVPRMFVYPPRGNGKKVGMFATRTPNRLNPIGLTIAKIKKIQGNRIYTFGLDILDGSPLLDIKPYIRDFDMKEDSNLGWIEE
ncbi:MAG: tRNA (N6-threonylcarbamoyladenosine(37)-N6)-methyltransferase TrmO [Bacteroidales bacterium]|nr:tRNA (N6-threonylcarbamoyladenosine(37)-N6)-methyltransferase TrmO [Bacteroidales bacterium]